MGSLEFFLGVLSVTIAGTAVYFKNATHDLAVQKHKDDLELAKMKREDDLFDRRFELYEKLVKLWIYYNERGVESSENNPYPFSIHETGYLILKSGFLFDKEIESVVSKMVTKSLAPLDPKSESEGFPKELFEKYLNVK